MKWPVAAGQTTCGPGSTLELTRDVRAWLPGALKRLGVTHLLDAPCGDRHWIRRIALPCAYTGVDHEPDHIEAARDDGADVLALDIRYDELPACDAVLARDFLQHLSRDDAARALANIRRTGAKWILTTCHGVDGPDIETGDFRFVNMRAAWGEPIDQTPDGKNGRILGVWAL